MPLQNRVDPFGAILAVPARGLFTGNRGVIHDPGTKTLLARRWTTKAWIICACSFKDYRRQPMGRNAPGNGVGWTELFFLDEVTALAAGHRPCFHCRRHAATAFARAFASGQGRVTISAPEMDAILHVQRLVSFPNAPRPPVSAPAALPDGTILAAGDRAFAVKSGRLLPWSFDGYGPPIQFESEAGAHPLRLVTPPATVATLTAGYAPVWHATTPIVLSTARP